MAISEQYKQKLRNLILQDIAEIRKITDDIEPLGSLLYMVNNERFSRILACGDSMYEGKFMGHSVGGYMEICRLKRFVLACCEEIYLFKSFDCGFFMDGITYTHKNPLTAIVTWNEILSGFMWKRNPDFVLGIERIHNT